MEDVSNRESGSSSVLWWNDGSDIRGLTPLNVGTLLPFAYQGTNDPNEGRQYYENEERRKRFQRFFTFLDQSAKQGATTDAEFRQNRQKILVDFIRKFRNLRQDRLRSTEGYLINRFRQEFSIQINQDYDSFLRSRQPMILEDGLVIGALNADSRGINQTEIITPYSYTTQGRTLLRFLNNPTVGNMSNAFESPQEAVEIYGQDPALYLYEHYANPNDENFVFQSYTWRQDKDHPMKHLITPVQDQHSCGCCWALAAATSASDAFAIAGYLQRPVLLSWTSILACSPACKLTSTTTGGGKCSLTTKVREKTYDISYQCGGGNMITACNWLVHEGVLLNSCMCYEWCNTNPGCLGKESISMKELSLKIPACGSGGNACQSGCLPNNNAANTTRFYLNAALSQALSTQNAMNKTAIQNHLDLVQNWLKSKGAVVATFIVYKNFVNNASATTPTDKKNRINFVTDKNPGGVYLENVGMGTVHSKNSTDSSNIVGAHTVSVIGFSQDPVHWTLLFPENNLSKAKEKVKVDKNGFVMVNSWVVRNSWSTQWGDNGYVKFATVPYNVNSSLDVIVNISSPTAKIQSGGMVLLEAGKVDFFPSSTQDLLATDFTTARIIKTNGDVVEKALAEKNKSVPPPPVSSPTPSPSPTPTPKSKQKSKKKSTPTPEDEDTDTDTEPSAPKSDQEDITGGDKSTPETFCIEIEKLFPHCGGRCPPPKPFPWDILGIVVAVCLVLLFLFYINWRPSGQKK